MNDSDLMTHLNNIRDKVEGNGKAIARLEQQLTDKKGQDEVSAKKRSHVLYIWRLIVSIALGIFTVFVALSKAGVIK